MQIPFKFMAEKSTPDLSFLNAEANVFAQNEGTGRLFAKNALPS